jgi:hypothetical protein
MDDGARNTCGVEACKCCEAYLLIGDGIIAAGIADHVIVGRKLSVDPRSRIVAPAKRTLFARVAVRASIRGHGVTGRLHSWCGSR